MNTAGGFILEASSSLDSRAGPINSQNFDRKGDSSSSSSIQESLSIRKLSSKQEIRLMNYLDDAFMQVSRGYNKRHNIKTSSVPDIQSFLRSYDAILVIIASIPPIGPSATLLISYLLRYTNEILEGIVGYELVNSDTSDEVSNSINEDLKCVVHHLSILDRVWSCVLRGHFVDLQAVKRNIDRNIEQDWDTLIPQDSNVHLEKGDVNGKYRDINLGRYPPVLPNENEKEGKSVMGSKGYSTVAQTHRIRLRNLVALGKESLFEWMRIQLNVPVPPKVDTDEDEEIVITQGDMIPAKGGVKEEDDEIDLEEVDTNHHHDVASNQGQGPRSHYEDLFAKTIDPDASDTDEDAYEEDNSAESQDHRPNGKHKIEPSLRSISTKKSRLEQSDGQEVSSASPIEDSESLATFSGTEAVMKWDVKFAHLFSHTLRCLSDIQEYSNHRDSTRQEAD